MAQSVEAYIDSNYWKKELDILRRILLASVLKEEVKWGTPHYTLDGKILIGIAGFKAYFGVWFHQGVFLTDPKNVLVNAQEGTTKALRQWRFQSISEMDEAAIKSYIKEAIKNHREGKELKPQAKSLILDDVFKTALNKDTTLKQSFESLTAGKQKEYAAYIYSAKQHATKARRLEKITPMIKDGMGLNDKYKRGL